MPGLVLLCLVVIEQEVIDFCSVKCVIFLVFLHLHLLLNCLFACLLFIPSSLRYLLLQSVFDFFAAAVTA